MEIGRWGYEINVKQSQILVSRFLKAFPMVTPLQSSAAFACTTRDGLSTKSF